MLSSNHLLYEMHRAVGSVAKELRGLKNVAFITIGQKRVRGVRTPDPAAVVYVSKKENVSDSDTIPRTIPFEPGTDIKTDVVELLSPPSTFALQSGNLLAASDGNYGVCTVCFTKNGASYAVTNAHVALDVARGGAPCSMSLWNPTSNQTQPLGPVIWSSGLSPGAIASTDVAVVRADQLAVEPYRILGVGPALSGTSHFVPGSTTYWFISNGAVFNCAYPEAVTHPYAINVEGVAIEYANFWVLQMTQGASAAGQSGALICRTDPNNQIIGCGLAFGGAAPNYLFAFSFDTVLQQCYTAAP